MFLHLIVVCNYLTKLSYTRTHIYKQMKINWQQQSLYAKVTKWIKDILMTTHFWLDNISNIQCNSKMYKFFIWATNTHRCKHFELQQLVAVGYKPSKIVIIIKWHLSDSLFIVIIYWQTTMRIAFNFEFNCEHSNKTLTLTFAKRMNITFYVILHFNI